MLQYSEAEGIEGQATAVFKCRPSSSTASLYEEFLEK